METLEEFVENFREWCERAGGTFNQRSNSLYCQPPEGLSINISPENRKVCINLSAHRIFQEPETLEMCLPAEIEVFGKSGEIEASFLAKGVPAILGIETKGHAELTLSDIAAILVLLRKEGGVPIVDIYTYK